MAAGMACAVAMAGLPSHHSGAKGQGPLFIMGQSPIPPLLSLYIVSKCRAGGMMREHLPSANSAASIAQCAHPVRACACWQAGCQLRMQNLHSHPSGAAWESICSLANRLSALRVELTGFTVLLFGCALRKRCYTWHAEAARAYIMCEHVPAGKLTVSIACGTDNFPILAIRVPPFAKAVSRACVSMC